MIYRLYLAVSIVLAGLCLMPMVASAQAAQPSVSDLSPEDRARVGRLFNDAKVAFEAGDYVEAIDRLQRAYKLYPDPDIYYRIGQAYEGLDDPAAAIEAYEAYLAARPEADDRTIVRDRVRNLRRLLEADRQVPGVLLVETEPSGAQIWLDSRSGFPVATSPARIEVADGEHFIYVAADGYDEVSRKIVIRSGQTSNIVVALNPTPDAPRAEGSIAPWVAVGTGAAFLVGGITTTFLALDAKSTVDEIDSERRAAYADGQPIPERTQQYDDSVARQQQMWVATAVLSSAGALLVGAGLVWWLVESPDETEAGLSVGITPTGAAMRVTF